MSTFTTGGLISGIDSNTLISQLMQLERQPILRIESKISTLQKEQDAVRTMRTTLQTLRNKAQDFQFGNIFNTFNSPTSDDTILTADVASSSPLLGAFDIDVQQLASSSTAVGDFAISGAITTSAALDSSGITDTIEAGTFTINGVEFTVDPATDSLDDILSQINASAAGVTATHSFDAVTGYDKVTFENTAASDTSIINFGADADESNLLSVLALTDATQSTGGSGSTVVSSTRHLGGLAASEALSTQSLSQGSITTGTFSINGVSITVNPAEDSLLDVIGEINASDAGVTASYDSSNDTIRVTSDTLGSRTIRFGSAGDTSNFLSMMSLDTAVQTAGQDAEFTVNGGDLQTRNTNDVTDAISGVTLSLLSVGESTVTVNSDDDSIVEKVKEFIDAFNDSVTQIRNGTGLEGSLSGDSGIRSIETYLRATIFAAIPDVSADYGTLLDIGISTGDSFDSTVGAMLSMDEDAFREALLDDRGAVEELFTNSADTGVADLFYDYLDDVTKISGFLNSRAKANGTIDQQIQSMEDQIERIEDRLLQREDRLRRQFSMLEQMSSVYQQQSASLSSLSIF